MENIKILHTGDIHLDSPFSGLDSLRSEVRRNELRGAFTSLMTYARTENADLLLITGDMFDVGFATRETISLIIREISKLKCPVVISPGNHDCAGEGSVWKRNVFPENTYIFTSEELSSFEFPEIGVRVYGWGFEKTAMRTNPLAGKRAEKDGFVNVLSAHCDLTSPISSSCPLTAKDILAFGADYSALGHIHNPDSLSLPRGIVYCGCLEGRSYDETGPKGAVVCEIGRRSAPGEEVPVKYSRVRFSKRRYESRLLAVDGIADGEELKEKVSAFISERKFGDDTLLRLTLTGRVREDLTIDTDSLSNLKDRLYALDIRDETTPDWNASSLSADPTVRGEFYRVIEPLLTSPEPEKRKIASMALRYGLAALAGEPVADALPAWYGKE
ncbi:MAG: DNA repair exonuclease [Clostridia bacterium]|nr:DNA repair exonuclease [Clostridia bacterium]